MKKNNFQLFYCFHVAALLFMSARPIWGRFLPILMVFCQNYQKSQIFRSKLWFFVILNTSLRFWFKILSRGAPFYFRPILADFHEYTLNITSHHVIEAIDGYF